MQTIAFMTPVNFLRCLSLVALVGGAAAANATNNRGPDNSSLHIGLRLLSGCELRTTPPRASCSRGTPFAVAQPSRSLDTPTTTSNGQEASVLAGPMPNGGARITTIAF
ncbi:hypothetical protein [Xanthomonas vesicatoria]|uniref:Secreted protein n=1 Tax=Xanthomonas vesicatoria TaxID=56460 RepID=A0AAJ0J208_9XANT|nr:hypothetical protein [Xanthomonas vesicatoria]APO97068.1 hypothetical protein BI313_22965 [Xanthomonas vesicatoria]KHM93843.1 hypothetical protein OR60_12620 [Xanthomonas vesicatoria]KHM98583.1 hypothetical protein OR61_00480 [Xanthomonas vesicatoria]KTF34141.1 hypothetical protein LMG920_07260 [Xanthomonas vesicatoria]KTF38859.1 hypothetical protein LMG919_01045 [Xanthomonas vesicatoria]